MGGLGIPHPDEIIQGFRQNLLQKISKQIRSNPNAHLPRILAGLLVRANRPSLDEHIQYLGPKQWKSTGNRIQPWNRMLGLAFHAVADLPALYETSRESWHQCCGSESERIRAFLARTESESEIFVPDSDSDPVPDPVI